MQASHTTLKNHQDASQPPLAIAILGQAGVGKTSLLNAIFDTCLPTGDTHHSTAEMQRVTRASDSGQELWIYDLPGIGESEQYDAHVLALYQQVLVEADLIIWAIYADSRATAFDAEALSALSLPAHQEGSSARGKKLICVLTKADVLHLDPWILLKQNTDEGEFIPGKETKHLFEQKTAYFQETLFAPYHCQIIACSSRFHFNLDELVSAILHTLGPEATERFQHLLTRKALNRVPLSLAKTFCNILLYDDRRKRIVFDLAATDL